MSNTVGGILILLCATMNIPGMLRGKWISYAGFIGCIGIFILHLILHQ